MHAQVMRARRRLAAGGHAVHEAIALNRPQAPIPAPGQEGRPPASGEGYDCSKSSRPWKPKTNVVLPKSAAMGPVPGRRGRSRAGRSRILGLRGECQLMKSRETLIRLKRFQVDEKRRQVVQIETMIAEFDRIASDLDREIQIEQDRAGIHDPAHYAYPTYAKAAMTRRDNLKRSAEELTGQLDEAKAALGEAFEELKKVELLDERDQLRERAVEEAREQAEFDRIGLVTVRGGLPA